MIPPGITRKDIFRAFRYIDEYDVPKLRHSKHWDIITSDGSCYPPKYTISKACEFSVHKQFLTHDQFITTEARMYLKRLEFDVLRKDEMLDDYIDDKSKSTTQQIEKALAKLNKQLKPMRKIIIERTLRNDTPIIRALKKKYKYQCQFPSCNAIIKKSNGELYIEVAHIEPVSLGGQSILSNLIVLCPNHHKEFDVGKKIILKQDPTLLHGILNGKKFTIKFN